MKITTRHEARSSCRNDECAAVFPKPWTGDGSRAESAGDDRHVIDEADVAIEDGGGEDGGTGEGLDLLEGIGVDERKVVDAAERGGLDGPACGSEDE